MKKRIFLGLVLGALAVGGAFALPDFRLSVGGGAYFTSDFGGGVEVKGLPSGIDYSNTVIPSAVSSTTVFSRKTPYVGGGGFVFFDATYAEVSLGFWGGGGRLQNIYGSYSTELDMSYMGFDISLLGKYPFNINGNLSFFPLLGFTGRIMASVKNNGYQFNNVYGNDATADFSSFWFKTGGGFDFSITDKIFLRGNLLYGLRVPNEYENKYVNLYLAANSKTFLGHGLEIKMAIGYRF